MINWIILALSCVFSAGFLAYLAWEIRSRNLHCWMSTYLKETHKRRLPHHDDEVHLLLCIADHFEPYHGNVSPARAHARVRAWSEKYPTNLGHLRDSDGRPPRHTFFYPIERYDKTILDSLGDLCNAGFGEVEIHLHHDADTADTLRERLTEFTTIATNSHGLLGRDRRTGHIVYGFVHGNWALDNSHPDGQNCGVDNELEVLRETGCYADFTMPSAPSPTQTKKINSIYYSQGAPGHRKSHNWGTDVDGTPPPNQALLLVQGPLLFNYRDRKWGLLPRLENGCLQASQPPSLRRLSLWLKARIQVKARPDWFFVKLHAHGAPEDEHTTLLGGPMVRFHDALANYAASHSRFYYHYVTAREMVNLVHAAEDGWKGSVEEARDYRFTPIRAIADARA
jgi:hypothetical protein